MSNIIIKKIPCKYRETSQGGLAINSKDGRETVIPTCISCSNRNYCDTKDKIK